jgi:hypothetical protein
MKGVVYFELIPHSQTLNQAYCGKYWSGYMKMCIENGKNFGPKVGFSIITMLQLRRCSL